ncbi:PAS-domain containing protein [Paracraurococcus lichenis]|uniref:histidine kinase n=1 Tax=Paracraurococcus lichenis TaxID=3064888 RepID=A0ABT9DZF2_9PROT|nr:PAS-domain containing protein [Paracraurococcus sp. LOR1-02]MDO9709291.1 PAS-domain containing protein [Paracraurococcus sp. LOR1-02]
MSGPPPAAAPSRAGRVLRAALRGRGRLTAIAILLLWAGILLAIRADDHAAGEGALRESANMARTVEAQVAGRIEAIDTRLRFAQALYARDPEGFRFGPWSGIDPQGDIPVGYVLDRAGFLRIGRDGPTTDGEDRSGQDYVRAHLEHPEDDRLLISAPIMGRIAGRQIIVFSRPLRRDGVLDGVVLLAVDAQSFSRLYLSLDMGQGVIALIGFDGIVRAWAPNPEEMVGRRLPDAPTAAIRAGAPQVSGRLAGMADGLDRFVTLRRVGHHPLVVSVGLPAEAVLAPVRADRNRLLALGLVLSVLAVAVSAMAAQRRRAAGRARAALEAAVSHVSQGIMMVDPDGRVAVVNARAVELLGLPPGLGVPGRPIADIIAWQAATGEFGRDPPPELRYRSLAAAPGTPPDRHERVRPNGTVLEIRTEHLPDGSHVRTYTDLTEARRVAASIAEARDRALAAEAALAATVENVPHGVLMIDAANRIVIMTRRALEMLDLPEELGRPGTDVRALHRFQVARGDLANAPRIGTETRMALAERPPSIPTYERELANGRVIEVRTTLLADGRAVRTYTDVTERRAAARAQEQARVAAEANMRARTEFLAMVSHELRTPLNAVIGLSGLLLDQGLPEAQAQQIRLIREAGDHLLALVNDILDMTRLERGQLSLQEAPLDIEAVVQAAVGLMAPQAEAKGLGLRLEVAGPLPGPLLGDAGRLRQVLLNLLGNAVKFTDAGSIAVRLAVLSEAAGTVRLGLSVADTGIGIPPETQARLFDAFVQGESGATRRFAGAGLGLTICRMLIERMGGSIALESAPGSGSTFRCEIPLRRAPAVAAPPAGGLRVLVAEDILANRLLITHQLGRLGHAVEAVANGAEAVAAVRQAPYDLVLMDVMMPVMDGLEATRRIRALPGAAGRIPIIALTAHGSPEAEAECLAAGMDRFESKPLGPDALRAAIAAVLEARAIA